MNHITNVERIAALIVCSQCDNLYTPTDGTITGGILPCGHAASLAFFFGGDVRNAARTRSVLDWLFNNGLVAPVAREAVYLAGGRLDDFGDVIYPDRNLDSADWKALLAKHINIESPVLRNEETPCKYK